MHTSSRRGQRRAAGSWPALQVYARLDAHVNGNGGGGSDRTPAATPA